MHGKNQDYKTMVLVKPKNKKRQPQKPDVLEKSKDKIKVKNNLRETSSYIWLIFAVDQCYFLLDLIILLCLGMLVFYPNLSCDVVVYLFNFFSVT